MNKIEYKHWDEKMYMIVLDWWCLFGLYQFNTVTEPLLHIVVTIERKKKWEGIKRNKHYEV